jgi:hypothetical protein
MEWGPLQSASNKGSSKTDMIISVVDVCVGRGQLGHMCPLYRGRGHGIIQLAVSHGRTLQQHAGGHGH